MADSLEEYKKKRKFNDTPEPKGKVQKGKKELRFVIQKHDATRLHYDFRIELEGVLKSWAVPKGPSLNPADKRLAMMVEDHPMEYEKFEGIIPEGNYGAGTVMVWDEGTYEAAGGAGASNYQANEQALIKGLKEGNLKFIVKGKKVKGEFALVKIKNRSSKGNEWLLIKKNDKFATELDVTEKAKSVISKRSLEQIQAQSGEGDSVWRTDKPVSKRPVKKTTPAKPSANKKKPVKRKSIFHEVAPMLATLTDKAVDAAGWLFEIKWDGYRAIAEVNGKDTVLYSRNKIYFGDRYPEVVEELKQQQFKAVFDGEVVVVNDQGFSDFQSLQNFGNSANGTLVYYVFDILFLNGEDLTSKSLIERKEILKNNLVSGTHVRYNDHILEKGSNFFKTAKKQGIEGIIGKKLASTYVEGSRTKNWIKVKSLKRQEAIIVGFTPPKGTRKYFGALVLGMYKNRKLVYIGNSGSGFNQETLHTLYLKMNDLVQSDCPLATNPALRGSLTWLKPELICEVTFQEWTAEGIMRVPIFAGLREDKEPKEVKQETEVEVDKILQPKTKKKYKADNPKEISSIKKTKEKKLASNKKLAIEADSIALNGEGTEGEVVINRHTLTFTNLQKIYWKEEGYTKQDLLEYYDKISKWILPYLIDRPQNLRRNPNGAAEAGFFQKNMPDTLPSWIETIDIFSESNNESLRYMLCQEKASLLYMANLGCIEINPWLSRKQNLDYPDYIVIDLDPQDVPFEEVIKTALAVKTVLDKGGIEGFPKTSGSRGIHIFIPMGGKYNYDQARQFAELIASLTHQILPDLTSLERSPEKRRKKIYLDYLQNRTGQTLAAPYCVRPRAGATVSTPLLWKEVKQGLSPAQFTIKTIFKRIASKGDLFQGIFNPPTDLSTAINKLR